MVAHVCCEQRSSDNLNWTTIIDRTYVKPIILLTYFDVESKYLLNLHKFAYIL